MNPITELVRTATRIQIETPSILLEKPEKKEAIEYLENDDEINITIYKSTVIDEDHAIIDICMKEGESKEIICGDCQHEKRFRCELTGELVNKEECEDYLPYDE